MKTYKYYENDEFEVGYIYIIEDLDRNICCKPENSKFISELIKSGCDIEKEIINTGLGVYEKQQYKYGKTKSVKQRINLYKNQQKMNVRLVKSWRTQNYHNVEDHIGCGGSPLAYIKKFEKHEYFDEEYLNEVIEFIDELVDKENSYTYKVNIERCIK